MKQIFLGAIVVIVVLIGAFFALNSYIYNEKQANTDDAPSVSLEGEYVCLPAKDLSVPFDECAAGLLTLNGYYAIDLGLLSSETPSLVEGDMLRAQGIITPVENLSTDYWQRFPVIGIFSITDSLEVEGRSTQPDLVVYSGVLPCASCEGIETTLSLTSSTTLPGQGTYLLTEAYLGENDAIVTTRGEWYTSSSDGSQFIHLADVSEEVGEYTYRVEASDRIRFAGLDGTALESDLPYDLLRSHTSSSPAPSIFGQEWAWTYTEYADGRRAVAPEGDRFILTLNEDGQYTSSTDCNAISGEFSLEAEVVSFGPALSTRMFCEGSQETVYTNDLLLSNSFVIQGGILKFNLNRDYGVMYFEAR